jgi:hypothetical protein
VAAAAEPLIWVEAEAAAKRQLVDNAPMNDVNPDALSGGKWIASFSHPGQPTGTAEYAVEVPAAGKYRVWARAMPGSGLAYRVDDAKDPVEVAVDRGQDPIPISADANPFWPGQSSWFDAGSLELTQGKHTLTWYLGGLKSPDRYGGLDCFVLTTGKFVPNGKYKPGEKSPQPVRDFDPAHAWDFKPGPDKFDPAAMLDLRSLNEKAAGEHGFVQQSADGDSFLRGDGQPIRFWAAGLRTGQHDMKELRREARFLAKHGVNAIRVFAMLPPTGEHSKLTDVNEEDLDSLFMTEAAMKAEGIYTFTGAYWPVSTQLQKSWGATDPQRGQCEDLVYFDPKFQVGYKAWMKALCTRKNPYTGLRIADDPAVAVIQLQNEDSLIWWGTMGLKGGALKLLLGQYADFLIAKHGSLEKTRDVWHNYAGVKMLGGDDWAAGLPGMLNLWDFSRDIGILKAGSPGFKARIADQMEFLARTMRRFNADMVGYLRRDLGCKQLINANNWRTVDLVTTQDAEYWSDSATNVIARNIYTGGMHQGGGNGWLIVAGHYYSDASMLQSPLQMPTNVKQPLGHPFILTEVLWCPPNLYQSEAALLVAAQQSLTGLGAACWFSNGVEPDWQQDPRTKWTYSTPVQIGQFPAAALLYRQGLLRQGQPAVIEHRSLQDLWECKIPLIGEEPGWDPNRDQANMPRSPHIKTVIDPLAYWVGPVRVVYGSDAAQSTAVDLSKYIDRQRKTVRSITGEAELDYGRGVYRVNAPAAQAACGFLGGAGPQRLADVTIACGNRYASIVVVPLDGQPINASGKLLVQAGTLARPTGWSVAPFRARIDGKQGDCFRILDGGKMPFQVENLDASLLIANPRLSKAVLLDVNGMATQTPVELKQSGGKATVVLPANTIYLVLQ